MKAETPGGLMSLGSQHAHLTLKHKKKTTDSPASPR